MKQNNKVLAFTGVALFFLFVASRKDGHSADFEGPVPSDFPLDLTVPKGQLSETGLLNSFFSYAVSQNPNESPQSIHSAIRQILDGFAQRGFPPFWGLAILQTEGFKYMGLTRTTFNYLRPRLGYPPAITYELFPLMPLSAKVGFYLAAFDEALKTAQVRPRNIYECSFMYFLPAYLPKAQKAFDDGKDYRFPYAYKFSNIRIFTWDFDAPPTFLAYVHFLKKYPLLKNSFYQNSF